MPKIDDAEHGYTIEDLHRKWKSGWKELAELAKSVYGGELAGSADEKKPPLDRLLCAFEEFLDPMEGWAGSYLGITDTFPDHWEILNLAASSRSRPYSPAITVLESKPSTRFINMGLFSSFTTKTTIKEVGGRLGGWYKEKDMLRRALQRATRAFAESETFEGVLAHLASRENGQRYREYWRQHRDGVLKEPLRGSAYRNEKAVSGEWLSSKVDSRLRDIMRWLCQGTAKSTDFKHVWWECLRVFMTTPIGLMLGAQEQIRAGTPLYIEQIDMLRKYVSLGRVQLDFTRWDDEGYHQLRMHMTWTVRGPEFRSPWITMSEILLTRIFHRFPVFFSRQMA